MPDDNIKAESEPDYGKVLFSWSFEEFPTQQISKNWYVLAAIVVFLLLLFSIFTSNFLFAIIVIISAAIVFIFQRSTSQVDFKITEDGILLNKRFYDYKNIKNFYIIYKPPEVKTLYFEPKSFFSPRIPIFLQDQDPVKIREALLEYLEEDLDKEDEPLSDQFSKILKI